MAPGCWAGASVLQHSADCWPAGTAFSLQPVRRPLLGQPRTIVRRPLLRAGDNLADLCSHLFGQPFSKEHLLRGLASSHEAFSKLFCVVGDMMQVRPAWMAAWAAGGRGK